MVVSAASHLEPVFEPVIEKAGFKLVRLRIMGGAAKTLQVMAERPDGSMDVEGCSTLSHALLDFIEAEDPIEGEYELEVSSPGIDRPLTRLLDFARWSGHEAKIELNTLIEGRKRFRATLLGLDGQDVVIRDTSIGKCRHQISVSRHRQRETRSHRQAHQRTDPTKLEDAHHSATGEVKWQGP
jgi:ribosome maturation factor RimP